MTEQMKPSGIDWIGDIPNEWDITKVKYRTSQIGSGTTPDSGNPLYYEDGCFPWIQSGDLYNTDYIKDTEKKITELAVADFNALTWYEKEFVVVAMYGASVGNIAISQISSYTNQACCVLKAKDDDLRYLFYFLSAGKENMLQMAFGGTQPNISQVIIKNLPYLEVSHKEQKAIADFLDKECAQIDSIAADLEKQIELLQQYKKSLITEMTTPDDSCNWTKTKIKYIGEIRGRIGFRGYSVEDTVDPGTPGCAVVLGGTNIMKDGTTDYENLTFLSENKYFESPEIMLYGGEILITKVGAGTGENSVYDGRFERATTNPNVMILIPKKFVNSQYINYLLLSKPIKEDMKVESTKSGAQPAINQGYVNNIVIYIPTLERQDYIVKYLDAKCAEIEDTIRIKKNQLNLISQHKKSLIYEYVTGKKRVKEVR